MATEKTTQAVPEEQISTTDDTLKSNTGETTAESATSSEELNEALPQEEPMPETEDVIAVEGDVSDNPEAAAVLSVEPPAGEPAGEKTVAVEDVQEAGRDVLQEDNIVEPEDAADNLEETVAEITEDESGLPGTAETALEPVDPVEEEAVAIADEPVAEEQDEPIVIDEPILEPVIGVAEVAAEATETAGTDEPETDDKGGTANAGEEPAVAGGEIPAEVAIVETGTITTEVSITEPAKPEGEESPETVDFSEEEAELDKLAADKPEFDLGEEDESEQLHSTATGSELFDPAGMTKSQLLNTFAILLSDKPVQTIRREVEAIKVAFYKLLRTEQDELRRRFIEDGGEPEDFSPPVDNEEERLKDLFSEYRKRRDEFIAQLDRSKEENLRIKTKVIDDLKELVNSSETLGNTFSAFRELQQRWREAGPVPQANVKDLWETYNHHVENFYSYIKINKELRDLDLKKNYEAKIALCEEAEALLLEPSIINSFHRLQKLHEQWRETGPVAKEYKESLWERFREASSRINKQHQEYFDGQKEEQKRNLELKTELCIKTEELANGVWTTRKEWNKASDKLLEIQKVWKTIGFAPRKDNARIYERFRNACDRFFEQKRMFYQQIKVEMDHNLQLKNEICEAAEAVQDSEDWKKTTDELIALQKKWKEIGPVARRHSDAVWKRFRAACDHFFNRKSGHFASKDAEQDNNLRLKKELLEEIAAADIAEGGFDLIKDFQRRWSEIGFVPIKQKDAIQKQYKEAMDTAFSTLRAGGQTVRMDRFRDKVRNMKTSGDKRLRYERDRLYNKVKQMESEIALLENNIGFFSNSKNAESMIRDVKDKIENTRKEMAAAIEKINLIDSQEE